MEHSIRIIQARTSRDVKEIVDLHIRRRPVDSPFPINREVIYRDCLRMIKSEFGVLAIEDDEILGGIIASKMGNPRIEGKILSQMHCIVKEGRKGYKTIIALHDALEIEAIRLNCDFVISTGDYSDTACTFTRILEKHGWQRRSYMAFKQLKES